MAVEAASFSTLMLWMSEGFRVLNIVEEMGAPSRMNKGVLLELMELIPRRRMLALLEGSPLEVSTLRPET